MSKKRLKPHRHVHRWHRWFGMLAALFALNLAVTGVLLNHTEALQLDSISLQAPRLLKWYGIEAARPDQAYPLRGHWLSQWSQQVFLDAKRISIPSTGALKGGLLLDHVIVALLPKHIALLTLSAELIDVLPLPDGYQASAISADSGGGALLQTSQGILRLDATLSRFEQVPVAATEGQAWVSAKPLPNRLAEQIQRESGAQISLERFLLDLHSGRLFGKLGVWVMDLAALAIAGLAISGMFMWARRRQKTSGVRNNRNSSASL